jgi:hypothetical protein
MKSLLFLALCLATCVHAAELRGRAVAVSDGVPRVEFETHGGIASAVEKFAAKTPSIDPQCFNFLKNSVPRAY